MIVVTAFSIPVSGAASCARVRFRCVPFDFVSECLEHMSLSELSSRIGRSRVVIGILSTAKRSCWDACRHMLMTWDSEVDCGVS